VNIFPAMRTIVTLLLILGLMQPLKATPPKIEPFDQAFERFSKEGLPRSEELLRELRVVFSHDNRKQTAETLEVLAKYMQNISADNIPGIQRAIQSGSDTALATWLRRLTTDLTGFRRTVDRMLIENLASNEIHLDGPTLEKLKKYWYDEDYYTWRFSHEADQRTPQTNRP
jgi:hypothetical protein